MNRGFIVGDGPVRRVTVEEICAYQGSASLVWVHIDAAEEADLGCLHGQLAIPEVAQNALTATETRPRCEAMEEGALVNLRGLSLEPTASSDRLVSIRMWVRGNEVVSVSRRSLAATSAVVAQIESGGISDAGDLVAAFARAISTQLDPEVADLGDRLDDLETDLKPQRAFRHRMRIARVRSEAISFRRFVAPDRDALQTLAGLDYSWIADDDRLHIREAADRFARMAEELEAVRERAALLHEQLTDIRSEQMETRTLLISIVALIFLPLTFITGLLGMNVEGIPFAREQWAFWGVVAFCILVGAAVSVYFARRHWLSR